MEAILGLGTMGMALIAGVIVYTLIDEKKEKRGQ